VPTRTDAALAAVGGASAVGMTEETPGGSLDGGDAELAPRRAPTRNLARMAMAGFVKWWVIGRIPSSTGKIGERYQSAYVSPAG
jgi:hypothetical protein